MVVESGAGNLAYIADDEYRDEDIRVGSREEAFTADIVVKVQPPTEEEISLLGDDSTVIGFLNPLDEPLGIARMAERGVTAISMELVPRISRAQTMDALSAMSTIAGYKAVLRAADRLPKFFPLLTTAAGTIRPAEVFVIGAGVAGLQAIATARRLGAVVSAYDIRAATREQVESLGASFVELELPAEETEEESGYARELEDELKERQPELLRPHLARADVVITTAPIPGRPAPMLIPEETVEAMRGGSVIVDVAAPNGGNCLLTEPGEIVDAHRVIIDGPVNLPAEMPLHASQMFGRTLVNMIQVLVEEGEIVLDLEDEIFDEACIAHAGAVRNERVRGLIEDAP
jgi:NAD(P) transhydrogenase subunit alpha